MISVVDLYFLFQNYAKISDQDFPKISNDFHESHELENQENSNFENQSPINPDFEQETDPNSNSIQDHDQQPSFLGKQEVRNQT